MVLHKRLTLLDDSLCSFDLRYTPAIGNRYAYGDCVRQSLRSLRDFCLDPGYVLQQFCSAKRVSNYFKIR